MDEGVGTADAERVADMLKRASFDQVCRDLMDALLRGFAVSEIVWGVRDGLFVPERVVKRAQRRFRFVQQVTMNSPPALHLLTRENMLTGVPVPDRKFIVHRINPEDDNPYGTGLGLQLYWPVFFKRKGIIAWNKLNDRFGSPTPWGKYPRNAGPKEKGTLFDALRAISNDGVVMTPEGMQIELLESKLTGSVSTQESLCNYMDDWIAGVLLGQEPRASGGGALAAASKERTSVRLDLVQADSDLLSDTLNNTLIRWICEYNGLAPCLVYRVIAEEEDLKATSETDKNVAEMGFVDTGCGAREVRRGLGEEGAGAGAPGACRATGAGRACCRQQERPDRGAERRRPGVAPQLRRAQRPPRPAGDRRRTGGDPGRGPAGRHGRPDGAPARRDRRRQQLRRGAGRGRSGLSEDGRRPPAGAAGAGDVRR